MLRALLSLLKENLLVQGLGLPSDVEQTPYQTVIFIEEGPVSSAIPFLFFIFCMFFVVFWLDNLV
jgi:hypothetical protein